MRLHTITTLLLALAAGLAAGCGSDDEQGSPIPAASAAELQEQLDSIQRRFEVPGGVACPDITEGDDTNTARVQRAIDGLPNAVDADLRDALEQSFQRLFELVERECGEKQAAENEPEPEPEPVPEPETDTTETETPPPVDTTPTETVPEPPPATEEEPVLPPGQGGEPPGQDGENPGQGGGGGAVTPEDDG